MKKTKYLFVFSLLCFVSNFVFARVNSVEPWKPGIDMDLLKTNDYLFGVDLSIGSNSERDNFFELPGIFIYGAGKKMEVEASLGFISTEDASGINDLILGMKYQFLKGGTKENTPTIAGEWGVNLPTGDYENGLGTGGVGIFLAWLVQRQLGEVTGHFGIGYCMNSVNPDKIKIGNVFSYCLGVNYVSSKELTFYGELKGFNHAPITKESETVSDTSFSELYLAPGLKYIANKKFDFYCGILLGLTKESNNVGLFLGGIFR